MENKKKTGAKEWAPHSFNFQQGCKNGCKYCYARKYHERYNPDVDFDKPKLHLTKSAAKMLTKKMDGVIMFPTLHDIDESNWEKGLEYLSKLLSLENRVLWVTKGGEAARYLLSAITNFFNDECTGIPKTNLEIRITIGSNYDPALQYWEPRAPALGQRYIFLKQAKESCFNTSISCEPMLDNDFDHLTYYLPETTNGIWYGFMNHHHEKPELTATLPKLLQLKEQYGDAIHFKDSVQKALEENNG